MECFLQTTPPGFWWVDHGDDIWTGPFTSKEEARTFRNLYLECCSFGIKQSMSKSSLPISGKRHTARLTKLLIADINVIIHQIMDLDIDIKPEHVQELSNIVRKFKFVSSDLNNILKDIQDHATTHPSLYRIEEEDDKL